MMMAIGFLCGLVGVGALWVIYSIIREQRELEELFKNDDI